MAVIHNGKEAPRLPEDMNPNDSDFFYTSWTTKLNGAAISTSTWVLPAGFTEVSAQTDISITVDGVTYNDVNAILLSTSLTSGTHLIQNRITASNGLDVTRGFKITLDVNN